MTIQKSWTAWFRGAKAKPDWVVIGSLVLITICMLGMACICWARFKLGS